MPIIIIFIIIILIGWVLHLDSTCAVGGVHVFHVRYNTFENMICNKWQTEIYFFSSSSSSTSTTSTSTTSTSSTSSTSSSTSSRSSSSSSSSSSISVIGSLKAFFNHKYLFLPPYSELPPVAGASSLRK